MHKNMFSRKFYLSFMLALSVFYVLILQMSWQEKMPKYKLVFHDEFNSKDGKLDTTIWSRAPRAANMWAKWNSNSPEVIRIKTAN